MRILIFQPALVWFLALAAPSVFAQGGLPLWTNQFGGAYGGYDQPNALICDSSGNAIVTGYMQESSSYDLIATVKYSGNGTPLWTNLFADAGVIGGSGNGVAVDSQGRVFVSGTTTVTNGDIEYSRFTTLCYSSDGVPLWTNNYAYEIQVNSAAALVIDSNGHVVVTGNSFGGQLRQMYATVAYSSAGVPLWTNWYAGNAFVNLDSYAVAIAADTNGNVFVTGYSVVS